MDEDIVAIVMFGLILLVPVAGITARFALKPLIDSLIRIAEVRRASQEVDLLDKRLALVEQELGSLRAEVREVADPASLQRGLRSGPVS